MSSFTSTFELKNVGLRILGALVSVLVLLTVMEIILRTLPVVGGVHRQIPQTPATSARLIANRDYTWSLGWDLRHPVRGRTNAMGFPSPHDYTADKHAVALLGDSYVEALWMRYDESLAGRLDDHWRGRLRTFNLGLSGAALPHYLGLAREMGARFRLGAAVIVVSAFDYYEGFQHQEGLYRWSENPEQELVSLVPAAKRSGLIQIARESALIRYIRSNLKFAPSRIFAHHRQAPCAAEHLTDADRQRLARYVDALSQALRLEPEKIVLVFSSSSVNDIYERVHQHHGGQPTGGGCPNGGSLALVELRKLAASRGMRLVDVAPLLEKHYRANRRPLDFSPVDGHWNAMATAVIAGEIARLLP